MRRERFERLYWDHYGAVLAYALSRDRPDVAKDATAETFLVAWRRLDDAPAEPLAWLLGIARRCLSTGRRGGRRREALLVRLQEAVPGGGTASGDPADAVAERSTVLAALARLRPVEREVLLLTSLAKLTPAEAAAGLGCSRATFDVRLHRARARFQDALDLEDDPVPVPVLGLVVDEA